jgi:hypothetical protein
MNKITRRTLLKSLLLAPFIATLKPTKIQAATVPHQIDPDKFAALLKGQNQPVFWYWHFNSPHGKATIILDHQPGLNEIGVPPSWKTGSWLVSTGPVENFPRIYANWNQWKLVEK